MKTLTFLLSFSILIAACGEQESTGESSKESKEKSEAKTEESSTTENNAPEYTVEKTTVEPQYFLYMEDSIVMKDVAKILGQMFPTVFQYGMSNGLNHTPPTAQAIGFDPSNPNAPFLLRAGMFSTDSIAPGEDMTIEMFYSGNALTTTHIGPYEKVDGAYAALEAEAQRLNLEVNGAPWEMYTNDPGEVGMEKAETVVYLPVDN